MITLYQLGLIELVH